MTVASQLEGQDFVAVNGGSEFKFSEAVSFMVSCDNRRKLIIIGTVWRKAAMKKRSFADG